MFLKVFKNISSFNDLVWIFSFFSQFFLLNKRKYCVSMNKTEIRRRWKRYIKIDLMKNHTFAKKLCIAYFKFYSYKWNLCFKFLAYENDYFREYFRKCVYIIKEVFCILYNKLIVPDFSFKLGKLYKYWLINKTKNYANHLTKP